MGGAVGVIVGRSEARLRCARLSAMAGALLVVFVLGGANVALAATSPATTGASEAEPIPPLTGRSLSDALRLLQQRGWPVVFSSRLVRDSMRVEVEPTGEGRRALLDDLLRPHGLAVRDGAHDRLVVVAASPGPAPDRGRSPAAAPAPHDS